MSQDWPYRCTARIAWVHGVSLRRTSAGSICQVSGSESTNTGVAPV